MCTAHPEPRAPPWEFGKEVTGKEQLAEQLGEEQGGLGGGAEPGSAMSPPGSEARVVPTSRTPSQRKEMSHSKEESPSLFLSFHFSFRSWREP